MAQVKRRGVYKYQISVYLGRDENGKKIIHYETFTVIKLKLSTGRLN